MPPSQTTRVGSPGSTLVGVTPENCPLAVTGTRHMSTSSQTCTQKFNLKASKRRIQGKLEDGRANFLDSVCLFRPDPECSVITNTVLSGFQQTGQMDFECCSCDGQGAPERGSANAVTPACGDLAPNLPQSKIQGHSSSL